MKGRVFLALVSALILVAAPVTAPAAAAAADPATAYLECMETAEKKFHTCLEKATVTEFLCWSKYGYDKLWCSVKYLGGSIFE